jgi:hypothetical protein
LIPAFVPDTGLDSAARLHRNDWKVSHWRGGWLIKSDLGRRARGDEDSAAVELKSGINQESEMFDLQPGPAASRMLAVRQWFSPILGPAEAEGEAIHL